MKDSNIDHLNENNDKEIIRYDLDQIMSDRFARYAKYIIQERALPDARDGLKPVQRRILYAMNELNLNYNSNYKKSARVVGEVIGKYHPHGDSSVYEALVRLSQNWKLRYPLVDMHGNNGSIDGDTPAAMRYTEVRLSELSSFLLQDLEKKTVSYAPNFDDSEIEPVVLPSLFPNLLVNGASGIAAGYATNIPPHNLGEIINAIIFRIKNHSCKLKDLLQYIQGPDFPTGGIIQGKDGLLNAYETGRGKIIINAKMEYTNHEIRISEIPYEVVKQDLVKKLDDIRYNQPQLNIKEIRDETDRNGLMIVIELAEDANYEFVRKYLLKNSNLSVSYNFNLVSIINKQPIQSGLITLLDCYINHQQEIVTLRSKYELEKNTNRLEVVEGLIKAISVLDKVIKIIRKSVDRANAIENLMSRFRFTKLQAEAIVQLRLYRLTSTDLVALEKERKELISLIKQLKKILSDPDTLNQVIIEQLLVIKDKFFSPRLSKIEEEIECIEFEETAMVTKKNMHIWVSRDGYLKSFNDETLPKISFSDFPHKPGDLYIANFSTLTTNKLLLITSKGNYAIVPVYKIPETKLKGIGEHINTIASLPGNEKVISCFILNDFNKPNYAIMIATRDGYFKKTLINDFSATRISKAMMCIKLKDKNDEVVSAELVENQNNIIFCTREGFIVKYNVNELPELGLRTTGIKSVNLKEKDFVVGAFLNIKNQILLFAEDNYVKKINTADLSISTRPSRGISVFNSRRRGGNLLYSFLVTAHSVLYYTNEQNEILPIHVNEFKNDRFDGAFNLYNYNNVLGLVLPNYYDLTKARNNRIIHQEVPDGKRVNLSQTILMNYKKYDPENQTGVSKKETLNKSNQNQSKLKTQKKISKPQTNVVNKNSTQMKINLNVEGNEKNKNLNISSEKKAIFNRIENKNK